MYKIDIRIGKSKRSLFVVGDNIDQEEIGIIGSALTDYLKDHISITTVTSLKENHIDRIMSETDPEIQRSMIVENESIFINEICLLKERIDIIKSVCASI